MESERLPAQEQERKADLHGYGCAARASEDLKHQTDSLAEGDYLGQK
jgi:hypothetical protein